MSLLSLINRRRTFAFTTYFRPYIEDGDIILDYGCGDGTLLSHIFLDCKRRGVKIGAFGYDPVDRGHSLYRNISIFHSLTELPKKPYSLCLFIDVIHHMGKPGKASDRIVNESVFQEFRKALSLLSPRAGILIKDYVISFSPLLAFFQRRVLAIKDTITNPKEVSKSLAYLTLHQWYQLFSEFNLILTTIQDVPYLPLERVYENITGRPVLFLLERNHSRPSRSCFPQP